jgi:hypothetical protein
VFLFFAQYANLFILTSLFSAIFDLWKIIEKQTNGVEVYDDEMMKRTRLLQRIMNNVGHAPDTDASHHTNGSSQQHCQCLLCSQRCSGSWTPW